jgi:hypothetical protein
MRLTRNWIIAICLWAVFIALVVLNEKHPLANTAEVLLGLCVVVWRSICVFTDMIHHGDKPSGKRILIGLPNWYPRFLLGMDAKPKDQPKDRTAHSSVK